jgi:hypothetical protein
MDDIMGKVTGALGGFEQLVSQIPGYKGYKDKELRREADKLLREQLATRFDEQRRKLSGLQTQLVSAAKLEYVDDLERAAMKLQTLIDRIKTASYGYAGFFDAVKVKEEQLDALYNFDSALMAEVDKVAAAIDKVSSALNAGEGQSEAIDELIAKLQSISDTFGRREEAILQA